ncbi:MAG: hypothetical protein ACRC54_04640 [Fusobacteriaceae bacterium]
MSHYKCQNERAEHDVQTSLKFYKKFVSEGKFKEAEDQTVRMKHSFMQVGKYLVGWTKGDPLPLNENFDENERLLQWKKFKKDNDVQEKF